MSESQQKQVKQSFIIGSLTSSAGIFLSKAIGLFYVVPFTAIATENNMVFYTGAYNYYNILLQISSAGLPYAIAALIAKFASRNDYKSVLLVRHCAVRSAVRFTAGRRGNSHRSSADADLIHHSQSGAVPCADPVQLPQFLSGSQGSSGLCQQPGH